MRRFQPRIASALEEAKSTVRAMYPCNMDVHVDVLEAPILSNPCLTPCSTMNTTKRNRQFLQK